jgi:hypothetical protein
MIKAWLELPSFGVFATLALLYYGMAILLVVLTFRSPLSSPVKSLGGLVAPFFSSVALLFGLLTGFLANDIGDRNRQAVRAVQTEAGELRNVYTLSVASATDMGAIRTSLKAYVESTIHDEWPSLIHGETSPRTDAAYDNMLREISDPAITRDASAAVHAALLAAAVRAGTARNDRHSLSADHTNTLKWASVLLLGIITQIALALVHLERPRAMFTALIVFGSAAVVALGLIAMQEYPFEGAFQVSPAPYEHLLALSEAGPNSALPSPAEKATPTAK